ncbi:MAG: phosphoribosylformylglycinamidine synthase I [Promethearchaeota archaeon]
MKTSKAIILMFPGSNCHIETKLALEIAGFSVSIIHINELIRGDESLEDYHLLALVGGFSYGDDIASGKVAANKLIFRLKDAIIEFAKEKLIIGICNGFQILVKTGLLPAVNNKLEIQATLTNNDIGHFYCNWVYLKNVNKSRCIFTKGIDTIQLPVAHGEGKFMVKDMKILDDMIKNDQIVFKYMKPDGSLANGEFYFNPANSYMDIAGICDPTGRILGMMPHPERYIYSINHPQWTLDGNLANRNGLLIFKNARNYVHQNIL